MPFNHSASCGILIDGREYAVKQVAFQEAVEDVSHLRPFRVEGDVEFTMPLDQPQDQQRALAGKICLIRIRAANEAFYESRVILTRVVSQTFHPGKRIGRRWIEEPSVTACWQFQATSQEVASHESEAQQVSLDELRSMLGWDGASETARFNAEGAFRYSNN